jgi:Mg-chelatase subunit ChlD
MSAAQNGADTFINISGNQIQAGLVSFTTTATTRTQLAVMGPSNQTALINAINALGPTSSTCIQCGLMNACNELVSSRARPTATKVVVLLTDGMANYCTGSNSCTQGSTECMGCDVEGAAACRADNVTVYTIGFGSDVDSTELTNIAYITNGEYYFAPNVATLTDIFQSIGRH